MTSPDATTRLRPCDGPVDPTEIRYQARRPPRGCLRACSTHHPRLPAGLRPGRLGPGHPVDPRHRGQLRHLAPGHRAAGQALHGHRPRPAGPRALREAAGRLLGGRPTPTACATCSACSRSTGSPWSGTRSVAAWRRSSPTSSPSAASGWCWSGSGGVGRTVSPLLRLAAVPGVELLMPLFGLPPVQLCSRVVRRAPARLRHRARAATPRRSWPCSTRCPTRWPAGHPAHAALGGGLAGPGHHHAGPGLSGRRRPDADHLGPARRHHPAGPRPPGPGRHARQRVRDLRRGGALPAPHRPGALRRASCASSSERPPATYDAEEWREPPPAAADGARGRRRQRSDVHLPSCPHVPRAAQRRVTPSGCQRRRSVQDQLGAAVGGHQRPVVSLVMVASQTWVVRPRCSGAAVPITTSPSLALEMKLALHSTVVKLLAPSGQC